MDRDDVEATRSMRRSDICDPVEIGGSIGARNSRTKHHWQRTSLYVLREHVDADTKVRVERTSLEGELTRARSSQVNSEREVIALRKCLRLFSQMLVLLTSATADFGSRHRVGAADLKKRLRDAEHRLRARLGTGVQADAVRQEIASGDRQTTGNAKSTCKATLAELQPAHEAALRRHQSAGAEVLAALERESDVVALATER